eukprot:197611_1
MTKQDPNEPESVHLHQTKQGKGGWVKVNNRKQPKAINLTLNESASTKSKLIGSSTLKQNATNEQEIKEKETRKGTLVTMLSGYEDIVPKEIEISDDRFPEK